MYGGLGARAPIGTSYSWRRTRAQEKRPFLNPNVADRTSDFPCFCSVLGFPARFSPSSFLSFPLAPLSWRASGSSLPRARRPRVRHPQLRVRFRPNGSASAGSTLPEVTRAGTGPENCANQATHRSKVDFRVASRTPQSWRRRPTWKATDGRLGETEGCVRVAANFGDREPPLYIRRLDCVCFASFTEFKRVSCAAIRYPPRCALAAWSEEWKRDAVMDVIGASFENLEKDLAACCSVCARFLCCARARVCAWRWIEFVGTSALVVFNAMLLFNCVSCVRLMHRLARCAAPAAGAGCGRRRSQPRTREAWERAALAVVCTSTTASLVARRHMAWFEPPRASASGLCRRNSGRLRSLAMSQMRLPGEVRLSDSRFLKLTRRGNGEAFEAGACRVFACATLHCSNVLIDAFSATPPRAWSLCVLPSSLPRCACRRLLAEATLASAESFGRMVRSGSGASGASSGWGKTASI